MSSAFGANVYIRDGGTGDGSAWNNALDDLPATLTRGNTYYVADGTYSGYTFNDLASGSTLITIKKATSADHGTETGWQSTYGDGQATFNGQVIFDTSNWVFNGQVGGGPGSWTSGHGFRVLGGNIYVNPPWNSVHVWEDGMADNVTISHVEIDGTGTSGTTAALMNGFGTGFYVSYLYTRNNAECFMNTLNADDCVVEYCYVGEFCTDCSEAIHGEIFSWKYLGSLTVRYNIFTWVESTGGIMIANTSGDNIKVYGNVFYRPAGVTWTYGGDGVVGGWVGRTDLGVYNMLVYNNTFINIPASALSPLGTTPGTNRLVRNNYFYNSATGLPSGDWNEDYDHYQDSGGEAEPNGTAGTGDPFTNFAGFDFSLVSNTTSGTDLGSPYNVDMLGRTRTTWTRGAVEFSTGSPPVPGPVPNAPVLISAISL